MMTLWIGRAPLHMLGPGLQLIDRSLKQGNEAGRVVVGLLSVASEHREVLKCHPDQCREDQANERSLDSTGKKRGGCIDGGPADLVVWIGNGGSEYRVRSSRGPDLQKNAKRFRPEVSPENVDGDIEVDQMCRSC